jgi:XTP/dITP diphosphohydrolase
MRDMREMVIATSNPGKFREMSEMLKELPLELMSLADFGPLSPVEETGNSFGENALIKAKAYAAMTGKVVLADDSGLEVHWLGGEPGVRSARYAGKNASDAENTAKLLDNLKYAGEEERRACFVCEMAVARPTGEIVFTASGNCTGQIAHKPTGVNGFGYDPVFVPVGFSESFGELSPEIKKNISHRSAALKQIIDFLGRFYGQVT